MPTAPNRLCTRGHLVAGRGRCPTCEAARQAARDTSAARGYDEAWHRLRARHAAAHPACEPCWRRGRLRPVAVVDHIVPFEGLEDPGRLDPTNLQSLCKRCNDIKTAADHARRRRSRRDA